MYVSYFWVYPSLNIYISICRKDTGSLPARPYFRITGSSEHCSSRYFLGDIDIFLVPRSLARDPELFADAEKFDPQRWLNEQGQVRKDLKFPNFGFGRR